MAYVTAGQKDNGNTLAGCLWNAERVGFPGLFLWVNKDGEPDLETVLKRLYRKQLANWSYSVEGNDVAVTIHGSEPAVHRYVITPNSSIIDQ